jgi:hypothetical protein
MGVARGDEVIDVFVQLVVLNFIDIHHVAAFVVCETHVFADGRL